MVECRFVSYSELEEFFISGDLSALLGLLSNGILVSSVSDVLYIAEQFQKNNIKISLEELNSHFDQFNQNGSIFCPEIDRHSLLENMFDEEEGSLWNKPCNSVISPRFSMSLISIKLSHASFWADEVFETMEEYYLTFEAYG